MSAIPSEFSIEEMCFADSNAFSCAGMVFNAVTPAILESTYLNTGRYDVRQVPYQCDTMAIDEYFRVSHFPHTSKLLEQGGPFGGIRN